MKSTRNAFLKLIIKTTKFKIKTIEIMKNILEDYNKLKKEFEDYKSKSISWDIEDFEQQAKEKEEWHGEDIYDRSKFKSALELMIRKHDASIGINWDLIDIYLSEYCRK